MESNVKTCDLQCACSVRQTLRAYIIIMYFGSKETNISCKNVVNNLVLKHYYLYVIRYFERQFINLMNVFLSKTVSQILPSAVGGKKTYFNKAEYTVLVEIVFVLFLFLSFEVCNEVFCFTISDFHWVAIELIKAKQRVKGVSVDIVRKID